ncbi:hypothetical protein [Bradyrhizobium yuanmingense]|nr:hypothetical protein [Bradyrhizobium yuanmingense]
MKVLGLVWHFGVHIVVGTVLFTFIGTAAVILHLFVQWIETLQTPLIIPYVLKTLEYVVFALDVLAYLWFLFRIVWQFMLEVRDETR